MSDLSIELHEKVAALTTKVEHLTEALTVHMEDEKIEGRRIKRWLIWLTIAAGLQISGMEGDQMLALLSKIF